MVQQEELVSLRSEASDNVVQHTELASLLSEASHDEQMEGPEAESKVELFDIIDGGHGGSTQTWLEVDCVCRVQDRRP